ncbi:PPOX class putative F420-dependent enzyme [Gordonia bronchialis DSM 43247]|uniref:PPOX class putative F420-dependent enzyme n=1 Tax=Gordonia bronchialis (strain ATCC 25592 / DSM 43247 / BCRC 13721 / JCM 3198 / KCTC 3076 / NBRC 16047 / NCTC 10667) TaxID=526226 RepID=D0L4N5_GORB4|nr:PPOX class F420-dependent oxidoreductase [Gordonia bronchialis]ACY23260.1 PPOX class putative F420-dependent enzyme [Gordonia bronchialis DSM 43247]MCC3321428.1 PPOX class F420-dependent oxidoreductase [Gordonia bronchialis]QGS23348.1 PPOX class F420-dependent oxidoreductase [Gordonia bronchialis]STQ66228.1 PPOX class probable F420-dependent enzyme, Rv2061 family [Gordonia bronchialis]
MTQDSSAAGFGTAGTAKYVQLTTFRKDGTPVATPVWAALDGGRLLVWTETEAWKVKRLRRDPRVVVQACDARGKKVTGDRVEGTGAILDAAGTERTRSAISKKYGLLGWLLIKASLLRRGKDGTIGIAITAGSDATSFR